MAAPTTSSNGSRLTLAMLARAKRLPVEFLEKLQLRDLPAGGVALPYLGPSGETLFVRERENPRRTDREGNPRRFWQPRGVPLAPYGLHRLDQAGRAGFLIVVEGESDCWVLWYRELPALGLPGSNAAKALRSEHVEAVGTVYVNREPDVGGPAFIEGVTKRLAALGFDGKVYELRLPDGIKDPADLHVQDPERFLARFEAAIQAAVPLEIHPARSNGRPLVGEYPLDQRGDAWEGIGPAAAAPAIPEPGTLLSTVRPESVAWLWPGRVPFGKLTILDGDPGLGKSVLTMDLAARVSAGLSVPLGDRPLSPAGVVILNAEDGLADTVLPRLVAAGGDPARVLDLAAVPDATSERLISLPYDLDHLRRAVQRVGAALVIIDPLMAWIGGDHNTHRDQDCRRALHPLARLAEETGAAVLVVRHLNKMTGGNPLYRGGGSIGIIGAARSGLLVAKDPDNPDRRVLASTKCNLAKLPPSLVFDLSSSERGAALRVGWIGDSAHTAESLLAAPRDDEDRDAVREAVETLRAILEGGPLPSEDVKREARRAGISERTLQRAKSQLGAKAQKVGFTGSWHWSLPAPTP